MASKESNYFYFYFITFGILFFIHIVVYFTFFYRSQIFGVNLQKGGIAFVLILLIFSATFPILHSKFHLPYVLDFILAVSLGAGFLLFVGAICYYIIVLFPFIFIPEHRFWDIAPYIKQLVFIVSILVIFFSIYKGTFEKIALVNQNIFIKNLKVPLKIVQISDLHINTLSTKRNIQNVINLANSQNADAIVLTGDIIDYRLQEIEDKVDLLKNLRARDGIYYILGNHEMFHSATNILNKLKTFGWTILNNASVSIKVNDNRVLNVVGIPDYTSERFLSKYKIDLKKAIFGGFEDLPTLLLSHQPKVTTDLKTLPSPEYKVDLVLSGHTHGGQIFPFNFLVKLQQPYVRGMHDFKDGEFIYISVGSGTWGPPMRLGSRSEVVVFNLLPAP